MSRVDRWRISSRHNSNRIKSGRLGNVRHKVHKISDRYPTKGISQFHKLEWKNKRQMLGEPMLRRVHLVRARIQYGKKILNGMYMYGGKNHEN